MKLAPIFLPMARKPKDTIIYGPNIVGKNIHKYREINNLSVYALAKLANIDRGNLYKIEQTGKNWSIDSLKKIADAMGISISALTDETGEFSFGNPKALPIYPFDMFVQNEQGGFAIEFKAHTPGQIESSVYTDGSFAEDAFGFEVSDSAMRPELIPGDVVIVDPNLRPEPNDIVLATVYKAGSGKTQAILRKYAERSGDSFELLPLDSAYSPEVSTGKNISIVGTVVEQRRPRRRA